MHIITFGCYLEKHQKLCKAIRTLIRDTKKILFFVVKMYARRHFKEEEMMKYKILPTNKKDD